jgi:hypothetical protein
MVTTANQASLAPEGLDAAIRQALTEISQFTSTAKFQNLLQELYDLPINDRARFVESVIIEDSALRSRGIDTPQGMIVQRSAFGDKRPTLFCVTKYLPPGYQWKKVTLTFDSYTVPQAPPQSAFTPVNRIG